MPYSIFQDLAPAYLLIGDQYSEQELHGQAKWRALAPGTQQRAAEN